MSEHMSLTELLAQYRDGDEHGWDVEFAYLKSERADQMRNLTAAIARDGIKVPILLGSDGRVWDGHHRLCAAVSLNLASVPVVHS